MCTDLFCHVHYDIPYVPLERVGEALEPHMALRVPSVQKLASSPGHSLLRIIYALPLQILETVAGKAIKKRKQGKKKGEVEGASCGTGIRGGGGSVSV